MFSAKDVAGALLAVGVAAMLAGIALWELGCWLVRHIRVIWV